MQTSQAQIRTRPPPLLGSHCLGHNLLPRSPGDQVLDSQGPPPWPTAHWQDSNYLTLNLLCLLMTLPGPFLPTEATSIPLSPALVTLELLFRAHLTSHTSCFWHCTYCNNLCLHANHLQVCESSHTWLKQIPGRVKNLSTAESRRISKSSQLFDLESHSPGAWHSHINPPLTYVGSHLKGHRHFWEGPFRISWLRRWLLALWRTRSHQGLFSLPRNVTHAP